MYKVGGRVCAKMYSCVFTGREDFLAYAINEWALRIKGRLFESVILEYLFHILIKAKIPSDDIYVF